jgi:hypothetical protein
VHERIKNKKSGNSFKKTAIYSDRSIAGKYRGLSRHLMLATLSNYRRYSTYNGSKGLQKYSLQFAA